MDKKRLLEILLNFSLSRDMDEAFDSLKPVMELLEVDVMFNSYDDLYDAVIEKIKKGEKSNG